MTKTEAKYLGAFLHDIGKFSFRSSGEFINHETLGEAFVKNVLGNFHIFNDANKQTLMNTIVSSIKGSVGKSKAADIASAKFEREPEEKDSAKTRRPLISIFSRVAIGKPYINPPNFKENNEYFEKYEKENIYYYNPDHCDLEPMPVHINGNIKDWKLDKAFQNSMIEMHKQPWENFISEVSKLKDIEDFRTFFTSFYKICEKYTSRVCSAGYASVPDISLFDHSRVVAGLSICEDIGKESKNKEFLLIYGDVSGIQNFIYNDILEADKAAKQLRGRSFYVKLLGDTIVNYLIRNFDVYDANVFFNSGGHFLIAVPNTSINRGKFIKLEKSINKSLFEEHQGKLFVILTSLETNINNFISDFAKTLDTLNKSISNEKKRKCFSILDDLFRKPIPYDKNYKEAEEKFYINLGKSIVGNDCLIEITADEEKVPENERADFAVKLFEGKEYPQKRIVGMSDFNTVYLFAKSNEINKELSNLNSEYIKRIICHEYKHNASNNIKTTVLKDRTGFSFKHIGSYIPTKIADNGNYIIPMEFEEIAGKGKDVYELLGILRMDVDNLGIIFNKGLKRLDDNSDENYTRKDSNLADSETLEKSQNRLYKVSRIVALSRELDYFFTGFINTLAKEYNVYLVYAGGDDLFAVGKWDETIEFAKKVREKFREFTCNNENFTLSGGIEFVNPNFPIARSSKIAGNKEDEAKQVDITKDRISLFGRAVKWSELDSLLEFKDELYKILDINEEDKKKSIPRGFLYNLLGMTRECFDDKAVFQIEKMYKTTAKMHYHFARRGVDSEVIEMKKLAFKRELAERFLTSSTLEKKEFYENFIIPASYVLLKTRKLNK